MTKIGILSDTHGFLDPKILTFFDECDEIWHAGDIGNTAVVNTLSSKVLFRAVHGNIDGPEIRRYYPEILTFKCENIRVMIRHIGGYPPKYEKSVRDQLDKFNADLFISGHSHILKIIPDNTRNLLHINPGAAGNSGIHKVKTAVRFHIDGKNISELDIVQIRRGL